jgi:hypothetical protein
MDVHKRLLKSCKWYRNWHKKRYSEFVHILIVLAMFYYNLYLVLEIFKYSSLI